MLNRSPQSKRRWGVVVAGVILATIVIGCSTKKNYKTLSFFFDGVPDPNAPSGFSTRRGSNLKPVFIHKPYAEQRCDACHMNTDDIFARAKVRENICVECHTTIQSEYAVMHGPVSANACRQCHSPHSSPYAHLLKLPAPALCLNCHEQDFLSTSVPEHAKPKIDCLSCHSGHGGKDRKFLKVAGAPTTQSAGKGAGT